MRRRGDLGTHPEFWIKNSIALLHCATDFGSAFPYHLRKMGWLGIVRIILG
jgi:hypothetical protein